MELPAEAIQTKEVLDWQGVHLLHYPMSSCSQKVRILLNEKRIDWVSHPVDLTKGEQRRDWYLGINPAGVVPVLVHDGHVWNESNDILAYLDDAFPSKAPYLPSSDAERRLAEELLRLEDGLHAHLRVVTFSFVMPGALMNHVFEPDEIDEAVRRFDEVLAELDACLGESTCLCGDRVMLPDIAWFITLHRLVLAGYPLDRRPRIARYYTALLGRPAFRREANAGALLPTVIGHLYRSLNRLRGATLADRLMAE